MDGPPDSEALWRLTLEHSPIGMTLVGLDGRILMVNKALCDMLGYDVESLCRLTFQEVTHPDDLDHDLGLFAQCLAGDLDSYRWRKRYLHAQGGIVWGDLSVALVRGEDGHPIHAISQILDVTAQHEQEQRLEVASAALAREHLRLEAIFETVSVGLLLIDNDGRYERMNRRHRETMDLPFPNGHDGRAGQLGHVYTLDEKTRLSTEDMPSYRAAHGEEFDDYTYWAGEDIRTRAAFSVSARQVWGPTGEKLGSALAYQEITDLVRAMKVQDEFVSSVSHELRTPLTSILGYLEILCENEDLPASVIAQLRIVERNTNNLQSLLSDLLLVGQVGEGSLAMHRATVDLVELVSEGVEASRRFADAGDVRLEVTMPRALTAVVDGQRIRQVLDNLLNNAIKYNRAGGLVSVTIRETSTSIEVDVSDTGIGIAQEEIELVFDRFFRGRKALEKHIAGTGLGLNIVSAIVAAHAGAVTLTSEIGHGTTFRVTLPRT